MLDYLITTLVVLDICRVGGAMANSVDVQAGVDELATALNKSVLIEDLAQYPVWWSTRGAVDPIRESTILYRNVEPKVADVVRKYKIKEAKTPVRTPALPELGMWSRLAYPIKSADQVVGYIWVLDPEQEVTEDDFPVIVGLAELAIGELSSTANARTKQTKLRESLIERLLHGPDENAALELAQSEKISIDSRIQVDAYGKLSEWRLPNGFSVHVETKSKRNATSGASLPLVDLAVAYRRAIATHRALSAGAKTQNKSWDDLGSWRLIVEAPDTLSVSDLHPSAQILLEPANEELLITARALLDGSGDVTTTAKELFIHRTTLYYRMDRILELTGVDLRNSNDRMRLQLALWLAAYRATEN